MKLRRAILVLMMLLSVGFAWWNANWSYRQLITITNIDATTYTDAQVRLKIDTASLISAGKLNFDCSDLRFVADDDTTELAYWLETGCNTTDTWVWVKIPSLPASADVNIYMYYGNPSATSNSNGDAVFIFFDDFEGDSLDTTKWTVETGTATAYSVANSIITVSGAGTSSWEVIGSTYTYSSCIIAESKFKYDAFSGLGEGDAIGTGSNGVGTYPAQGGRFNPNGDPATTAQIQAFIGGSTYNVATISLAAATWYRSVAKITATDTTHWLYTYPDTLISSVNSGAGTATYPCNLTIAAYDTTQISMDWVFVRQCITTDPTITVGIEEKSPTGISIFLYNDHDVSEEYLDPENDINSVDVNLTAVFNKNATTLTYYRFFNANTNETLKESTEDVNSDSVVVTLTEAKDYNFCVYAEAEDDQNNVYTDIACTTFYVNQAPQNLTLDVNSSLIFENETAKFIASAEDNDSLTYKFYIDENLVQDNDSNVLIYTFTEAKQDINVFVEACDPYNVCKSKELDVNVYTKSYIVIHDENTDNLDLIEATICINNTNCTVDSNREIKPFVDYQPCGYVNISLSKENYLSKSFIIKTDCNAFKPIEYHFSILPTKEAQNLTFQIYLPDNSTLLGDSNVILLVGDINAISDKKTTDSEGKVTFNVKMARTDYKLYFCHDSECYTYREIPATVKVPKDEKTLEEITPFNIRVGGLAKQTYNDQTTDVTFYIFTNTLDYYEIYVDANLYNPRFYTLRAVGNVTNVELQPYLLKTSEALITKFLVKDPVSKFPIPNVVISVKKEINNEIKIVEQKITDSTGVATVSLYPNDTYILDIYKDGVIVGSNYTIIASGSFYTLSIYDIESSITKPKEYTVSFNPDPSTTKYIHLDNNKYKVTVNITASGDLSKIEIFAVQKGQTIKSLVVTNQPYGGSYTIEVNSTEVDTLYPLIIKVELDDTYRTEASYMLAGKSTQPTLFNLVTDSKKELGWLFTFLYTLFIIAIVTGLSSIGITNTGGLAMIGAVLIGIGSFLGIYPTFLFYIAILVAIFGFFVARWL